MSALSSFQQVRRRNEDKDADRAQLRRQMLQQQPDASTVIELLATNMGFWLLGEEARSPVPYRGAFGAHT